MTVGRKAALVAALFCAVLLMLSFDQRGGLRGATPNEISSDTPELVKTMLTALKQPLPNQFSTPDSVVLFLLEQIKAQNLDEATRAFPIREEFTRSTFDAQAKFAGGMDSGTFWPKSPAHNAFVAFRQLSIFENLSVDLANGKQVSDYTTSFADKTDADIPAIEKSYDRSVLQQLKITSVDPVHYSKPYPDNLSDKLMGVTDICAVNAHVQIDTKDFRFTFVTQKLDGNWRIASLNYFPWDKATK